MFRLSRPGRWPASAAVVLGLLALLHSSIGWCGECTPGFTYKDGWLGGDDAYSVPLDSYRSLWLFADTFIGAPAQTTRSGAQLVANSIAISSCHEGNFHIRYFIPRAKSGAARPFFNSQSSTYRMWPLDGFVSRGVLYIALAQVVAKPGGGPFEFEMTGVKLARIMNPNDDPSQWRIDYLPLASGKIGFPGVAAIVEEPWVFLFTVLADATHPRHPMILARIALDHLDRPAESIAYLAKNGSWKRGLDWTDARIVIDEGHTEMSVRYHGDIRKWIAIQQRPGLGMGAGIRTAERLEGPWSSFVDSVSILETPPDHDGQTFCYAAKEHLEFASSAGALALTYVCSSLDFGKLSTNLSLYRPRVVRRLVVHLPAGSPG